MQTPGEEAVEVGVEAEEGRAVETMDVVVADAVVVVAMKRLPITPPPNGRSYPLRNATGFARKETRKVNRAERNDLSAK